jgi:hypothetical protein
MISEAGATPPAASGWSSSTVAVWPGQIQKLEHAGTPFGQSRAHGVLPVPDHVQAWSNGKRSAATAGSELDVPRKEFIDTLGRVIGDPARLEDLSGRITAFRLSSCFERLKRSGRLEDVLIDDPFDPEGAVSVKLTEAG